MRSVPVSKANWRNQACDPNLAPSVSDISGRQTAIIGFVPASLTHDPSETDLGMMRRALLAAEERRRKGRGSGRGRRRQGRGDPGRRRQRARGYRGPHRPRRAPRDPSGIRRHGRLAADRLYPLRHPGTLPHVRRRRPRRRLSRLVYAAPDPKAGYAGTLHNIPADPASTIPSSSKGGLLEAEAAALLRDFFQNRRQDPERPPKPLPRRPE